MTEESGHYRYDADLLKYVDHVFETYPGERVFENFMAHLNGETNVCDRTKILYINDLFGNFPKSSEYTFCTFICLRNITSSSQIKRELLREYIVWLVKHNIARSSVNRRLSALRSFYVYLLTENIINKTPIPIRTHQRNSPRSSLSMKKEERLPQFLTARKLLICFLQLMLTTPLKSAIKLFLKCCMHPGCVFLNYVA